jgi:hypothetical protein
VSILSTHKCIGVANPKTTCERQESQQSILHFHIGRDHPYLKWKASYSSCIVPSDHNGLTLKPRYASSTQAIIGGAQPKSYDFLNPWSIPDTLGSIAPRTPGLPTP